MHPAVGYGLERCIKSAGVGVGPRVDHAGYPTPLYQYDGIESPQIDGIATPVHTEVYE